jgi:hypothetical protein
MKKHLALLITVVVFTINAKAQSATYHAFSMDADVGFGGSNPGKPQSANGAVSFTVEPHYRLADKFSLGLRIQFAGVGDVGSDSSAGLYSYSCTSISGDYYFNTATYKGSLLIFAGAGLGAFTESDNHHINTTNLGIYPRLGLETGHFRASFEYNVTGGQYNYTSLNFGYIFGGGLKTNR